MLSRLLGTLFALFVIYLLSTGPVLYLEHQGKIPHAFYDQVYRTPVASLEKIPVAGPLLHSYIEWWQPRGLHL